MSKGFPNYNPAAYQADEIVNRINSAAQDRQDAAEFSALLDNAAHYISLIANADAADPIVADAREQMSKADEYWQNRQKTVGGVLAAVCFIVLIIWPLAGIILGAFCGIIYFFVGGIASLDAKGEICKRAYGQMQYRQSYDIHAMRVATEEDRQMYGSGYEQSPPQPTYAPALVPPKEIPWTPKWEGNR